MDPTDSRTPDLVLNTTVGVIVGGSAAKLAEHGGLNSDDQLVGWLFAAPDLSPMVISQPTTTKQV